MRPTRGKSNPKQTLPSAVMEQETKKMEEKLLELKRVMEQQKQKQDQNMNQSGSRWKMANDKQPIKNFAQIVIANHQSKKNEASNKPSSATNPQKPTIKTSNSSTQNTNPTPPAPVVDSKSSRPISNQSSLRGKENEKSIPLNEQIGGTQTNNYLNSSTNAEKNLQRAINLQKDVPCEAKNFLDSINLPQYLKIFIDNGFEELEIIQEINTQMLNQMKVPTGHQIKIMKKIKEMTNPAPEPTTKDQSPGAVSTSSRPYSGKRTDLVELEVPQKSPFTKGKVANSGGNGVNENINQQEGGGQLLNGKFDEKQSHASFLEALNEWRNQKPPGDSNDIKNNSSVSTQEKENKEKQSVRFGETVPDNQKKNQNVSYISSKSKASEGEKKKNGLFFMQDGGTEWKNNQAPEGISGETQTENKRIQKQQSCWICYQLTPTSTIIKKFNQIFCSEACIEQYISTEQVQCEKCNQTLFKDEGINQHGSWYCGEKCVPSVEQLMIKWRTEQAKKLNASSSSSSSNTTTTSLNGKESSTQKNRSQIVNDQSNQSLAGTKKTEEEPVQLDLSIRESQVLSLIELENKYQKLNLENEKLKTSALQNESKLSSNKKDQVKQSGLNNQSDLQKSQAPNLKGEKPTQILKENQSSFSNKSDLFQDSLQM